MYVHQTCKTRNQTNIFLENSDMSGMPNCRRFSRFENRTLNIVSNMHRHWTHFRGKSISDFWFESGESDFQDECISLECRQILNSTGSDRF